MLQWLEQTIEVAELTLGPAERMEHFDLRFPVLQEIVS